MEAADFSTPTGPTWSHATCIGECMIELAPMPDSDTYRRGFAGDTFNTAWYLASLCPDRQVGYCTSVGRDAVSDAFVGFAQNSGLDTAAVQRHPDRSLGLYMISLEDGERSFTYWRDQSAARTLAEDAKALEDATDSSDLLYFSGITLAILSPEARDRLLATLHKARMRGAQIVFDPNLRPRLWPDIETMTDAIMLAAGVSDVVLPSFEDEAEHFGDVSPAATVARYQCRGATTIVVKDGPAPVRYLDGDQQGEVSVPPQGQIIDTTAAGDSFNAGFLAHLGQAGGTPAAIEAAARVASRVIGARGALVSLKPNEAVA